MTPPGGSNESDNKDTLPTFVVTPTLTAEARKPAIFCGEPGQDPTRWLKEYERVSKYNRWDDTLQLANVYFFLDGTARQWYENNEETLTSWTVFETKLKTTFGDNETCIRRAKDQLKSRAQKPGESIQSYIQDVLGLCHQIDSDMSDEDKVSHLMKGVAEDVFQALLTKEVKNAEDFTKWCLHIEDMRQKRVGRHKFGRLPNVVPIAAIEEDTDIVSLIRRIVREEVQRCIAPTTQEPETSLASIEDIIRDEVEKTLAPMSMKQTPRNPQRRPAYAEVTRRPANVDNRAPRKTDVWRTEDNRPVCFYCGRPGHVTRYCRERKAAFEASRGRREQWTEMPPRSQPSQDEYSRSAVRQSSPSPSRGRSPNRRYRSPSPFRSTGRSPSRSSTGN